jgi:hypothetical protein
MHFEHLMGLIILAGASLLTLLTVPWHEIKKFALFGLTSGLGIAISLILVLQNRLGFWIYRKVDVLYLYKIPLTLSAAWIPMEIFLAHFLSRYQSPWRRLLLVLFIPAVAVGIHYILIWNRMLSYHHWNYLWTFLLSLGIHVGLAYFLNRAYKIPLLS